MTVEILHPDHEAGPRRTSRQPRDHRGPQVAQMQVAGGRGSEPAEHANHCRCSSRTIGTMVCPSCGVEVVERQKFCADCGASLRGVTEPTELIETEPAVDATESNEGASIEPVLADDGEPTQAIPVYDGEPTQPIECTRRTHQAIPVYEGEPTQPISTPPVEVAPAAPSPPATARAGRRVRPADAGRAGAGGHRGDACAVRRPRRRRRHFPRLASRSG